MNKFLELFSKEERSATIQKLAQKFFEEDVWIADGMELSANRKGDLQYFILDEQKCQQYESRFLIFGQATHSGSSYAFLKTPGSKNCDEWPILVLGDEGGAVVLARNIFDLMRFWTLDSVQPYVNNADYKSFDLWLDDEEDDDDDEDGGNEDYKAWILAEFGLSPLKSIEEAKEQIIQPAIASFQKEIEEIFEN